MPRIRQLLTHLYFVELKFINAKLMQTGSALAFLDALKIELASLKDENSSLKSQNYEFKQSLTDLATSRNDLVSEVSFLKDVLSRVLTDQTNIHSSLSSLDKQVKTLHGENANLRSKFSVLELRVKRGQHLSNLETLSDNFTPRQSKDIDYENLPTQQSQVQNTSHTTDETIVPPKSGGRTSERLEILKKQLDIAFSGRRKPHGKKASYTLTREKEDSPETMNLSSGSASNFRDFNRAPFQDIASFQDKNSARALSDTLRGSNNSQSSNIPSYMQKPAETPLKVPTIILPDLKGFPKISEAAWQSNENMTSLDSFRLRRASDNSALPQTPAFEYNNGVPSLSSARQFSFAQAAEPDRSAALDKIPNSGRSIYSPSFTDTAINMTPQALPSSTSQQQSQRPLDYSSNYYNTNMGVIPMTSLTQGHTGSVWSAKPAQVDLNARSMSMNLGAPYSQSTPIAQGWMSSSGVNQDQQIYQERNIYGEAEKKASSDRRASNPYTTSLPQEYAQNYLRNDFSGHRDYFGMEDPGQKDMSKVHSDGYKSGNVTLDINMDVSKAHMDQSWGILHMTHDTTRSMSNHENLTADGDSLKKSIISDSQSPRNLIIPENLTYRNTKRLVLTKKGGKGKESVDMRDIVPGNTY